LSESILKMIDGTKNMIVNTYDILPKYIFIIAIIILLTYNFFFAYPIIYYIGLTLFRLSLIFGIEFIICGFITDGIKKQII